MASPNISEQIVPIGTPIGVDIETQTAANTNQPPKNNPIRIPVPIPVPININNFLNRQSQLSGSAYKPVYSRHFLSEEYASRKVITFSNIYNESTVVGYAPTDSKKPYHQVKVPFFVSDDNFISTEDLKTYDTITGELLYYYPFDSYKRHNVAKMSTISEGNCCFFGSILRAMDPIYQQLSITDQGTYAKRFRQELASKIMLPNHRFDTDFVFYRFGKYYSITGTSAESRANLYYDYFKSKRKYNENFPPDPRVITNGAYYLLIGVPYDSYGNIIDFGLQIKTDEQGNIIDPGWGFTNEKRQQIYERAHNQDMNLVITLAFEGQPPTFSIEGMDVHSFLEYVKSHQKDGISISNQLLIEVIADLKQNIDKTNPRDVTSKINDITNEITQRYCVIEALPIINHYIRCYYIFLISNDYPLNHLHKTLSTINNEKDVSFEQDNLNMCHKYLLRLSSIEDTMVEIVKSLNYTENQKSQLMIYHRNMSSTLKQMELSFGNIIKGNPINVEKLNFQKSIFDFRRLIRSLRTIYDLETQVENDPIFKEIVARCHNLINATTATVSGSSGSSRGIDAAIYDIQDELIGVSIFKQTLRNRNFIYIDSHHPDHPQDLFINQIFELALNVDVRSLPLNTFYFMGSDCTLAMDANQSYDKLYEELSSPQPVTDKIMSTVGEMMSINIIPVKFQELSNPRVIGPLLHYDSKDDKIVSIDTDIKDFSPEIKDSRLIFNNTYPAEIDPNNPCIVITNVPNHYETVGIVETVIEHNINTDTASREEEFVQMLFAATDSFIINCTNKSTDKIERINFENAVIPASIKGANASIAENNSLVLLFKEAKKSQEIINKSRESHEGKEVYDVENAKLKNYAIEKLHFDPANIDSIVKVINSMFETDFKERNKPASLPTSVYTDVGNVHTSGVYTHIGTAIRNAGPIPLPVPIPRPVTRSVIPLPVLFPRSQSIHDTENDFKSLSLQPKLSPVPIPRPIPFVSTRDDNVRMNSAESPSISQFRQRSIPVLIPINTTIHATDNQLGEMGLTREEYKQISSSPHAVSGVRDNSTVASGARDNISQFQPRSVPIPMPRPIQLPPAPAPLATRDNFSISSAREVSNNNKSINTSQFQLNKSIPTPYILPVTHVTDYQLGEMGLTREEYDQMQISPSRPTKISPGTPLAQPPPSVMGIGKSPITDIANAYTSKK